jgi:fumarylacetoacetase
VIETPDGSPFGPANLPYGVFSHGDGQRRVGVAIGDHVLDVARSRPAPP